MGKRAQWSAKDWELYYSSSWEDPSYGRHQKQWGKGGGKDGAKTKTPEHSRLTRRCRSAPRRSPRAMGLLVRATLPRSRPPREPVVLAFPSQSRRWSTTSAVCETRLRRIEEEATEASQKWEAWQTQMKRSFITERAKYYEAVNKLKAEKQEMQAAQEEALEDLHGALTRPPADEMEIETVPEEAQRDWTALLEDAEKQEDVASKVSGVMGRNTRGAAARQELLEILEAHRAAKAVNGNGGGGTVTPPRKPPDYAARTPPRTERSLPGCAVESQNEIDAWLAGAARRDPYMPSPSAGGGAHGLGADRGPSRTRPTGPRAPVKTRTKPPVDLGQRATLSDKIDQSRARVLENPNEEIIHDSEEEKIGSLSGRTGPPPMSEVPTGEE